MNGLNITAATMTTHDLVHRLEFDIEICCTHTSAPKLYKLTCLLPVQSHHIYIHICLYTKKYSIILLRRRRRRCCCRSLYTSRKRKTFRNLRIFRIPFFWGVAAPYFCICFFLGLMWTMWKCKFDRDKKQSQPYEYEYTRSYVTKKKLYYIRVYIYLVREQICNECVNCD